MGTRRRYKRSELFLVRTWLEELGDGSGGVERRGRVQRVVDGEAHQFDDWPTLIELLVEMTEGGRGPSGDGRRTTDDGRPMTDG